MSVRNGDTVSMREHHFAAYDVTMYQTQKTNMNFLLLFKAYVADWKVELEGGAPHEVKDHSVEVCYIKAPSLLVLR